jgi:hypothetical protein
MANNTHTNLPQLEENNFGNWKFRVLTLLEERSVLEVVTGENDKEDEKYLQLDKKARNLIVQCLPDKYLEIIKNKKTAQDMFQVLKDTFERKSIVNKLFLRRKLINMKCSGKLNDHFLNFDKIITELDAAGSPIENLDKICYLLSTLPNEYENVITSLETMCTDKEISYDFVKARHDRKR